MTQIQFASQLLTKLSSSESSIQAEDRYESSSHISDQSRLISQRLINKACSSPASDLNAKPNCTIIKIKPLGAVSKRIKNSFLVKSDSSNQIETVKDLKLKVIEHINSTYSQQLQVCTDKEIKLVHKGKVLKADSDKLNQYGIFDDDADDHADHDHIIVHLMSISTKSKPESQWDNHPFWDQLEHFLCEYSSNNESDGLFKERDIKPFLVEIRRVFKQKFLK